VVLLFGVTFLSHIDPRRKKNNIRRGWEDV